MSLVSEQNRLFYGRRRVLLALLVMAMPVWPCALSQASPEAMLRQLRNPDWRMRYITLQEIKNHDLFLGDRSLDQAIVETLERDNLGKVCDGCDEDTKYEAYSSDLLLLAMEVASRTGSSSAYMALVYSGWNPDSELERWLAHRPESIEPTLKMLESTNSSSRSNAVYLLADLTRTYWKEMCGYSAANHDAWSKLDEDQVISMLRAKALREEGGVRCNAIEGLSLVGAKKDRNLLVRIEKDKDSSIAWFAARALKQIDEGKTTAKCSLPKTP